MLDKMDRERVPNELRREVHSYLGDTVALSFYSIHVVIRLCH